MLNGEWGLAMHVQSFLGGEERNVLIDFGYTPEVLLNNLSILKIDPSTFDAVSYTHLDVYKRQMPNILQATIGPASTRSVIACAVAPKYLALS